jgi:hypothetical protein
LKSATGLYFYVATYNGGTFLQAALSESICADSGSAKTLVDFIVKELEELTQFLVKTNI